jgi:hypothetical protein
LSADTPVATEEGEKPISEIEEGDEVLAYNEETGEVGEYTVTDTINHIDEVIIEMVIDGEIIYTTPEHHFYTDEGEWENAEDIYAGERIRSEDGTYGTVSSTRVIEDANQRMYNLTVEEAHTFFVGEGQWSVHNTDDCGDTLKGVMQRLDDHLFNEAKDRGQYYRRNTLALGQMEDGTLWITANDGRLRPIANKLFYKGDRAVVQIQDVIQEFLIKEGYDPQYIQFISREQDVLDFIKQLDVEGKPWHHQSNHAEDIIMARAYLKGIQPTVIVTNTGTCPVCSSAWSRYIQEGYLQPFDLISLRKPRSISP